jgi:hypothetical protein
VAVATPDIIDLDALAEVSKTHRREEQPTSVVQKHAP